MKLSVGVKLANTLSLTPQLQQAIRLLQLSSLELEQEVQLQLDSNPLLERIEDYELHQVENKLEKQSEEQSLDNIEQKIPDELAVDTDWDDIYSDQPTALATPEFEEREDNRTTSPDLHEHLLWQINLLHFSPIEQIAAHCILDALDERGYLCCDLDEILQSVQHLAEQAGLIEDDSDPSEAIELAEIAVVLKRIQRLDPVGVAARNLVECLSIQLENISENNANISDLIKKNAMNLLQHVDLLLNNDVVRLMRSTKLELDQLKDVMLLLKSLDPAPGAKFQPQSQDYQTPDVIVQLKSDCWHVFLNPDTLPRLRVNNYYANMIKRADQSDENQYLRHHMLEAKNFIKSVDERHKTLLRVATCIVNHQKGFLEQGLEAMKPLVLREIAEELELHESTISRVTTNKYMLTPRGLFELKYFFSSHVANSDGAEHSSTAIRAMIKKMISQENPKKPLSDSVLVDMLKADGVDVARRTVAKYRESMNIPSSSERKKLL
ncbi:MULTISPECIES: RNA polymerase factor sigma-54 [unclassified Acinetobacter]|uniref:RNA polymerase factor sigma-54 n=1 Tax=unclassified Acinetobacter TaxID=196816 RepID=UPI0035B947B0